MKDIVQEIKERLDIIEFVRQYVTLTPAGKNYKALCPFHKEKTPSFVVSPDRGIWHCFGGCGDGGDVIKFLMRYENLEFVEALKILAEKAGVDFKTSGGQDYKRYNVLYEINEAAKNFFQKNFYADGAVFKYLKERGLKEETVKEFELGLSTKEFDALLKHLIKSGFNIVDAEKAGLVVKSEKGLYWDRFRNRLMFPLYNHFGKVAGFTGRIMPGYENENVGKYVNSPETPIFNKSKLLYGLHKSKDAIRDSRSAVLVEGQMDFLMMWQDGVKNAVATSGTAVTGDHLKVLKRYADELVLSFDSDEAGQTAAERTIDLAEASDFSVKVLEMQAKDPADVVKESPGLMAALITKARSAMEFYFDRYLIKKAEDKGPVGFKKNIRAVLAKIKNIYSPVERSHWLKQLSILINIDERPLFEEMEALKIAPQRLSAENFQKPDEEAEISRKDVIAQRIISLVLAKKELMDEMPKLKPYLPFQYQAASADTKNLINLASLRSSLMAANLDEKKIQDEFSALTKQLKREHFKEQRQLIGERIKKAEASNNETALQEALKEFDQVSKMMQNI
ncbi:MAG: DNA primase [Candidatus Harrisonbacteria bacterium RIFCSPHIGHO2_01_FULL_44_13]|uniref:DNA primase n=1 Tax=Candidatus Harrisonbacteria bacterium RIFCSPLOWO2_01_FULL_44_18 TaxID=1798407 RepID=A0A1G1ZMT8_9BACT|nr:MAG: DNA primase [Candidatus Harrisonbacteria bacterium RIFCSPHIGHO2_01_FULL_44_13]OGY65871.1 MAG: DNA primase [Candidatus Harrisonbacteria bacterium RIFCSPLOWO2_01_FULL_44_18]